MVSTNSNTLDNNLIQTLPPSFSPKFDEEYYKTLNPRRKYEYILQSWDENLKESMRRIIELSEKEENEDATVWLAYSAMGGYWMDKDKNKGIQLYKRAIERNRSFKAAVQLGAHYWSAAKFSKALEYANIAIEFAEEKEINPGDAYVLIRYIKLAEKESEQPLI